MNTIPDLLRGADLLARAPDLHPNDRSRLRQAVVAAASDGSPVSTRSISRRAALAIVVAMSAAVVGSRIWSQGNATLEAAVRFEVRLAENVPGAGLQEVRIPGSDRTLYLHQETVVGNSDIARSRVVQGGGASRFGVAVEFTADGARKMRRATANHIGKPIVILIDGEVVSAPTVRGRIESLAVINGDFTKSNAERIAHGMTVR